MKRIPDATIFEFVPTEPKRKKAIEIIEALLDAGHEWKFLRSHFTRQKTKRNMAHSLAMKLRNMTGVNAFKLPCKEGKVYSKENVL